MKICWGTPMAWPVGRPVATKGSNAGPTATGLPACGGMAGQEEASECRTPMFSAVNSTTVMGKATRFIWVLSFLSYPSSDIALCWTVALVHHGHLLVRAPHSRVD